MSSEQDKKVFSLELVGNVQVVQLYADGFEKLTPKQRVFAYYLSLSALASRDICLDQHHSQALELRDLLETVYVHLGSLTVSQETKQSIEKYTKLFWLSNGPYDSYTSRKFVLECSQDQFIQAAEEAFKTGGTKQYHEQELLEKIKKLSPILFDKDYFPILTQKTPGTDWVKESAVNFYGKDLTQAEVEKFLQGKDNSHPLNSSLVKNQKGDIVEEVWRAGLPEEGIPPGKYWQDLEASIFYLEKAISYAENDYQKETLRKLIRFFRTGDLEDFRKFNIHWVGDNSPVDFIHGFIEVYSDPLSQRAEWESCIFWSDVDLTKVIQDIGQNAQYFEDRMPWDEKYKKKNIKPLVANVVNVFIGTGGTGPVSPIGINLPNEDKIREQHGSKSVVLNNITEASDRAEGSKFIEEFCFDEAEKELQIKYGTLADNVHTALHEVLGHASGKTFVEGDPASYLPGYYSTLEEARADLVAMWHIWDDKLITMGAIPSKDVIKAMYDREVRCALLTQLRRVSEGDQLEEDHMKNRQLIANYILRNSSAIKKEQRDGKTFFRVVDYAEMKRLIGQLLTEIMRIKAEGDLNAARALVDQYGLKIDVQLRDEVIERVKKLQAPSHCAYVMPEYHPIKKSDLDKKDHHHHLSAGDDEIVDIRVAYGLDLAKQMLSYSAFTESEKQRFLKETSTK